MRRAALALLLALACDDEREAATPAAPLDGASDADAAADGAGGGLAPADGGADAGAPRFLHPGDFEGATGCDASGFDRVELTGTWALDVALPGRQFGIAADFTTDGGVLRGNVGPVELDHLEQGAERLFFYRLIERDSGPSVRSYLACRVLDGGRFEGRVGSCENGACAEGSFVAVKVLRRPGEGEGDGLVRLGEYRGFDTPGVAVQVRVAGDLAYLARYGDGLRILDVRDPSAILPVGHGPVESPGDEIYNDVKLVPGYALVASNVHGVVVWDVADPARPVRVTNLLDGANVHTDFVLGDRLYLAATQGGASRLVVFDVADPPSARMLGLLEQPPGTSYLHDLYVEPGRAYLDYWDAGLVIADVADPAAPRELGRFDAYERRTNHSSWVTTIGGRKICVTGDEDFGAHARVLDVTDPARVELLATYQTRPEVSIHNIMAEGERAFIAYYQDGVRVLDLADPRAPREIAYYNTWDPATAEGRSFYDGAIGIDKVGDRIYVADGTRGLVILRLER